MDEDYALFAAIVAAGSLSAAARAGGLSPAIVSKRLARLETRLGAQLVHRTTRRLVLTAAGERFHADVLAILSAAREAEARVSGAAEQPAGRLRVSAPTSFGRLHIAPLLHLYLQAHPAVELECNLSDGFVDLLGERIDLAVRIAAEVPASLVAHRLGTSRRLLCAAPAYLAAHGMPADVADLDQHRLLAADGQLPWRLENGRRRATVARASHVRTNSSELVRELAITGVGIALRSLWDVADLLESGRLVRVLPDWEGSSDVGIYAVHLPGLRVLPAVGSFVTFLRTHLGTNGKPRGGTACD